MERKSYVLLAAAMALVVGLFGCAPAAPPAPPVAPAEAPPGVFVDPETGWWPGRMGAIADDAPVFGVGFLADVSGVLGFWNAPRLMGAVAAYEWVCHNEYGIAGRRAKIHWYDHKSSATEATAGYNKLRTKYIANHSCGTGEQQMLKPRYGPDKFLTLTCSCSPNVIYPVGYPFGISPFLPNQYGAFCKYISETWDYEAKGPPKMAYLTYASGYGRAFIIDQSEAYAKSLGIEKVCDISIPWAPADPESILAAAKAKGATHVFTNGLYATMGPMLRGNAEGGFNLQWCVNSFCIDEATIALSGTHPETGKCNADGVLGCCNLPLPTDRTEGMDLINEYWDEHHVKPEDRSASYIQAWLETFIYKAAIEETLVRVGSWDKVDAREIRLTLESPDYWMRDFRGLATVRYGPSNRDPGLLRLVTVENGKWKGFTDWFEPESLVPEPWTEPWVD